MSKRGKARERDENKEKGLAAQVRNSKHEIRNGDGGVVFARDGLPDSYWKACDLAREGKSRDARAAYLRLARGFSKNTNSRLRALVQNDLAVLDAMEGKLDEARAGWRTVVEGDLGCLPARLNLALVEAEMSWARTESSKSETRNSKEEDGGREPTPGATELDHATGPIDGASPQLMAEEPEPEARQPGIDDGRSLRAYTAPRVAVLSFLFNWPSTGGGNMHTAGLVDFLGRDGFEVRHFYARYPAWGIGRVEGEGHPGAADGETFGPEHGGVRDPRRTPGLVASEAIEFAENEWNVRTIRERFRAAVDSFSPDYVVISDAWNMKPHLAEAMRGYPTILLMQAQECLCPLNNLRLVKLEPVKAEQCPRNQLASPHACHACLAERGHTSGALHQVERALAGVGTAEYDRILRQSFQEAEAVLVLNPITAAMMEPFAKNVRIVPWGIDPARFPWPAGCEGNAAGNGLAKTSRLAPDELTHLRPALLAVDAGEAASSQILLDHAEADSNAHVELSVFAGETGEVSVTQVEPTKSVVTLFMAAVAGELIKGLNIAHAACRILRETRSDFEFVITHDPPGRLDEFSRSVGWCSQAELPKHYRAADICLVPTVAQDALSITSVEAIAAGKPVVASRIGGLPYTVTDGLTGLLFEPGNPFDLAAKIARLLDDPELRYSMGLAGRKRFEEDFMWPDVIKRYWRPLLPCRASVR